MKKLLKTLITFAIALPLTQAAMASQAGNVTVFNYTNKSYHSESTLYPSKTNASTVLGPMGSGSNLIIYPINPPNTYICIMILSYDRRTIVRPTTCLKPGGSINIT